MVLGGSQAGARNVLQRWGIGLRLGGIESLVCKQDEGVWETLSSQRAADWSQQCSTKGRWLRDFVGVQQIDR